MDIHVPCYCGVWVHLHIQVIAALQNSLTHFKFDSSAVAAIYRIAGCYWAVRNAAGYLNKNPILSGPRGPCTHSAVSVYLPDILCALLFILSWSRYSTDENLSAVMNVSTDIRIILLWMILLLSWQRDKSAATAQAEAKIADIQLQVLSLISIYWFTLYSNRVASVYDPNIICSWLSKSASSSSSLEPWYCWLYNPSIYTQTSKHQEFQLTCFCLASCTNNPHNNLNDPYVAPKQ